LSIARWVRDRGCVLQDQPQRFLWLERREQLRVLRLVCDTAAVHLCQSNVNSTTERCEMESNLY